ncbi:tRNA pseudouridine synthase B [Gracilibacillus boraciitolerans JCM 21714]|uniref:tRNA pseudouridine synthase B n=1 Tax=Gracilibacillus boraciitolerans JCM 21714 TaxID=1298598 RepID=W4VEE7_9BACI|nr:tRNA pseudouridine(55) synthase TruB [Gracilibacillus boraciitolerans]GAE91572.1 tRNA pseudouridine synthase B [Gracilibacillus boraciitolerans JCM 21714]
MDGILPLWKEKGLTSHDCVMKVRKILQTKKVGHTGTLDPEVEGVLPLCIGEATKIVPYLLNTSKTYRATALLGYATDTEDHTGMKKDIKEVASALPTEKIEQALASFEGEITQQVPLYSAVKINGKRLYEYARNAIPVERPYRQIYIHNIRFLSTTYDHVNNEQQIEFDVTCSKGTYIRTLCVDLGKMLGFPAHMLQLIRIASADFYKSDTITLNKLQLLKNENQKIPLLSMDKGLKHLDKLEVDEETKRKVLYGQKLPKPDKLPKTDFFRMVFDNQLLAIYQFHDNHKEIKPARVFRLDDRK